jgi:hypothetical protein
MSGTTFAYDIAKHSKPKKMEGSVNRRAILNQPVSILLISCCGFRGGGGDWRS